MAASDSRIDPFTNFNFRVEIDGVTAGAFAEVSGLDSETEIVEYRSGGELNTVRKLPGLTRYANIVLRRGVTDSTDLYDWRKTVIDGRTQRASGAIILLNESRDEVARWSFREGWPSGLKGPDLSAQGNEVAIEELTIAHEGFVRET